MTWRNILALGVVCSSAIAGCTVTTSVNGGDAGGGTADSGSGGGKADGSATGGKSGASTGGKGGAGGASTGGKGGVGGSSGGAGGSSGAGGAGGATVTSCNPSAAGACNSCLQTKCCNAWLDCRNDKICGTAKTGELDCIQDCMTHPDGGTPNIGVCGDKCAKDATGIVDPTTNALLNCIAGGDAGTDKCNLICFDVVP
jgi:hypothetical protein